MLSIRVEGFEKEVIGAGRPAAGLRARLRPAAPGRGDAIEAALRQRPTTLVHGDLRADNLLFGGPADNPVAAILDWQTVTRSLAAIDGVFLIGGSEPVAGPGTAGPGGPRRPAGLRVGCAPGPQPT